VNATSHLGPGSRMPAWVEAVDRACFGEPWGPLDECEHIWAIPSVGFARWRIIPEVQEAELLRIGVAEGLRRSGHGRRLLRLSQAQLARLGVELMHLEVRVSNRAARVLYESEGWVYRGLRKGYYRDGEDAALYSRGQI
jgi:ribosomal protein S18 acetylase RimI-like enzyme